MAALVPITNSNGGVISGGSPYQMGLELFIERRILAYEDDPFLEVYKSNSTCSGRHMNSAHHVDYELHHDTITAQPSAQPLHRLGDGNNN
jgi:hypothetical protein